MLELRTDCENNPRVVLTTIQAKSPSSKPIEIEVPQLESESSPLSDKSFAVVSSSPHQDTARSLLSLLLFGTIVQQATKSTPRNDNITQPIGEPSEEEIPQMTKQFVMSMPTAAFLSGSEEEEVGQQVHVHTEQGSSGQSVSSDDTVSDDEDSMLNTTSNSLSPPHVLGIQPFPSESSPSNNAHGPPPDVQVDDRSAMKQQPTAEASPTSVVGVAALTSNALTPIPEEPYPSKSSSSSSWWQDATSAAQLQVNTVVQQASELLEIVQIEVDKTQRNLTWDRQLVMTCILTTVASLIAFGIAALLCLGGLALISAPFWMPVAFLTSPIWIPVLLLSSPIWVTVGAVAVFATVSTLSVTTAVVLFFGWPEQWLPGGSSSSSMHPGGVRQARPRAVAWFLDSRQSVEVYLIKCQAKVLLYAAGVGPAADAAFLIVDRIDLKAVRNRIAQLDVERLKHLDVSEISALVLEAAQSLIK